MHTLNNMVDVCAIRIKKQKGGQYRKSNKTKEYIEVMLFVNFNCLK